MLELQESNAELLADMGRSRPRGRRQHVRASMRKMILAGRWPPGSKLVQQEVAAQLGTSVGVAREVLLELVNAGLVELEDNQGFFVSKLDLEKFVETYLVRAVHEGLAARLCCERASREDIRQLRDLAEKIHAHGRTATAEGMEQAAALDRKMHTRMIEIAANSVLTRVWESYWVPIVVARLTPKRGYQHSYREHVAMIDAIDQNRPDDAERLAREHIHRNMEYICEQVAIGRADLKWYV